jgi:hypothetical protein
MPTEEQKANLHAMQRADEAGAVRGLVEPLINEVIMGTLNGMVSHYRGGEINRDILLGKTAEISALLSVMSSLEGAQRAGETAREREFGDGTPTTPTEPSARSRRKSS